MVTGTKTRAEPQRVTGYDTDIKYYANRYKQGGRTTYSLNLSPLQVISTIHRPDPSQATPGNRAINAKHAQGFAKYFREQEHWVVPGMIMRIAEPFDFDLIEEVEGASFGVISFPRQAAGDIQILDGQHRILGFFLANEQINQDLDKARNQLATARRVDPDGPAVREAQRRIDELQRQRARFEKERVDLTIVVESDPAAYKQMFFDIADNAKGISGSVKARFDARKVVNRSLEAVLAHPLLLNRVDIEQDRIGRGSIYFLGARHVAEIIRSVIVGLDGRVSARQDKEWKEVDVAARANRFFDALVDSFTPLKAVALGQLLPDQLRRTSLLGSVLMLRILAAVYHDLTSEEHHFTDQMVREYFAKLAPHMGSDGSPVYPGSIWLEHTPTNSFPVEGAMAPNGRRQEAKAFKNALVDWAVDKPEWLDKAPVERPQRAVEDEGDTLLAELSEEDADAILRPETAAARKVSSKSE